MLALTREEPKPGAGRTPVLFIVAAMMLGLSVAAVVVKLVQSKPHAAAQALVPSAVTVAPAPEESAEPEEEPPALVQSPITSPPSSVAVTDPPPAARRTTKPRRPPPGPVRHASPAITAAPDER